MKNRSIDRFCRVMLLSLLSLWGGLARADEASDLFQKAGAAYLEEDFEVAIRLYQEILAKGWESGELYYNLGNAYYRQDQVGRAILNYERARLFLPADGDLERNLELANLRVVDKIEPLAEFLPVRWGKGVFRLLTARSWLRLGLFLYWGSVLLLLGWRFVSSGNASRWLARGTISLGATGLLVFALLAGRFWLDRSEIPAIIMVPEVAALSAPGAGATEVFRIHEGTRVRTGIRSSDWTEIILSDGKVGWVPADSLEIVSESSLIG